MLSLNGEVAEWSTHINCLSLLVRLPEKVASKVQVAPPSVDLYARMFNTVPAALMPIVVDQAVPSDVQSTVGSEWKESPVTSGSSVCPQVAPPFEEKNIAWRPVELMLFEAAMIFWGFRKLTRMSDSLRGDVWAPEIRASPLSVTFSGGPPWVGLPGRRSWCVDIHSHTSFSTSG